MSTLQIRSDWPFAVKRSPIFYGWVIWLISTLGILMSIPGQTMGMGVFTDHFIEAFGLTRTQLSIAYLFGTLASSGLLTRAGRFYDDAGARSSIVGASVGLGAFVVFIAWIDYLAAPLRAITQLPVAWITFPLILIGYFGVRFTGQGVLTNASRNVLLLWYDKRRGLMSGSRSVIATLAFSLAPVFLAILIESFGWRGALYALAAIVGGCFTLLALVLVRDTPEACGLMPDGGVADGSDEARAVYPDHTLAKAKQSPVFWVYAAALAFHSLFGTAVVFHIVAIFNEHGHSAEEAFGYFFPLAVVSVAVNLVASWISDYTPLKPFLIAMLLGFSVGAWGLLTLEDPQGYWLMVCGLGFTGGLWGVLSNLAFVRFFGRLHLGEISGLNMALTVVGSAIGPALFSVGNDLFGTYHAAVWLSLSLLVVLLVAAIIIPQPEPQPS